MAAKSTWPGWRSDAAKVAPILKRFYFQLHLTGLLSHQATERLFRLHPEWKHA
jgi:hypothetical protein